MSQELHQDGNEHLHAYVLLKEKIRLNKEQYSYFFDLNYDDPCYHPNVQPARSAKNVIGYVVKGKWNGAMQDFFEWRMCAADVLKKNNPKNGVIARMLLDGKSIADCVEAEPAYMSTNLRKFEYFNSWVQLNKKQELLPWTERDLSTLELNTPIYQISKWLNDNILKPRKSRTPHLMLIGPPLLGKTLLVNKLRKYLRVYDSPTEGQFFPPWTDGLFDLIVMEELHDGLSPSTLLRLLDGSPTLIKGYGCQMKKAVNTPIIITSNQSLRVSYANHKMSQVTLDAILSRVTVVYLQEFTDVIPELNLEI